MEFYDNEGRYLQIKFQESGGVFSKQMKPTDFFKGELLQNDEILENVSGS